MSADDLEQDIKQAASQLAPSGTLRVALNLSNSLLVSGAGRDGDWQGVAPDLARLVAESLHLPLEFVPYETPGEVTAAAGTQAWDIAMIGADPARAASIRFTDSYVGIEAGYLVPPGSSIASLAEVDMPGRRIAAFRGSAYELWLSANLKSASIVYGSSFDEAFERFRNEGLDALASLKVKLLSDAAAWPGSRVLDGRFMTVQQAIGLSPDKPQATAFLQGFVRRAKSSGEVEALIARHAVAGLVPV
jgi:polar amino acid transport system substrate-binding protein